MAITLTCLSYYYAGLTRAQLRLSFDVLLKLDNPEMEYELWISVDDSIPHQLRHLSGINPEDVQQFSLDVFPTFAENRAVIDFYLSQVVFPKAAKDFPSKLATSGWDLAEKKGHLTTGFSGTNDSRYLLPTSIVQDDPVQQSSTNALVLMYLLQPENNFYMCTQSSNEEKPSAPDFLQLLIEQDPEVRVLLDVGAQMLE